MTCGSYCTDLEALNEQPRERALGSERALASEKHVVQPLTWTKTMTLIRDAFHALIAQGCASQQETKPSSKPRLPLNSIEFSTHVTTATTTKTEIANGLGAIADEVGTVIASPVGDALGLMS
jgi:hypothetical protein